MARKEKTFFVRSLFAGSYPQDRQNNTLRCSFKSNDMNTLQFQAQNRANKRLRGKILKLQNLEVQPSPTSPSFSGYPPPRRTPKNIASLSAEIPFLAAPSNCQRAVPRALRRMGTCLATARGRCPQALTIVRLAGLSRLRKYMYHSGNFITSAYPRSNMASENRPPLTALRRDLKDDTTALGLIGYALRQIASVRRGAVRCSGSGWV